MFFSTMTRTAISLVFQLRALLDVASGPSNNSSQWTCPEEAKLEEKSVKGSEKLK